MSSPFVHRAQHGFYHTRKRLITLRTSKPAMFLEVGLGESALFTPHTRRQHRLAVERGFHKEIGQRKPVRICNTLRLGTLFTKIDLVNFVINDLRQMHRR